MFSGICTYNVASAFLLSRAKKKKKEKSKNLCGLASGNAAPTCPDHGEESPEGLEVQ